MYITFWIRLNIFSLLILLYVDSPDILKSSFVIFISSRIMYTNIYIYIKTLS
jgi:hypothetical protein